MSALVRGPLLITASLAALALSPSMLRAQTTTAFYPSPRTGANGYSSASIGINYKLMNCAGELWLTAGKNRYTLKLGGTYYYHGKAYPAPDVSSDLGDGVNLAIDVLQRTPQGNRKIGSAALNVGSAYVPDCYNARDFYTFAPMSSYVGADATAQQKQEFINSLYIQANATGPLTSSTAEQAIESRLREEKEAEDARAAAQAKAVADAKAEAEARATAAAQKKADEAAAARREKERKDAEQQAAKQAADAKAAAAKAAQASKDAKSTGATPNTAEARIKAELAASKAAAAKAEVEERKRESEAAKPTQTAEEAERRATYLLMRWQTAEREFAAKDYDNAEPIYRELLNESYFTANATRRLEEIRLARRAEMTLAAAKGMQALAGKTGIGLGAGFGQSFLETDQGLWSAEAIRRFPSLHTAIFFAVMMPGEKITNMVGGDDQGVQGINSSQSTPSPSSQDNHVTLAGERTNIAFKVGGTIPFIALGPIGFQAGYVRQNTTVRSLNLGMVGANFGDILRCDVTYVNGKPYYSGSITLIFD